MLLDEHTGREPLPELVDAAERLAGRTWTRATARPSDADADALVQTVVQGMREFLGADVAFIGEFVEGRRIFRWAAAASDGCPVRQGGSDPLEASYCARVADGRMPGFVPDASLLPELAAMPVTRSLPVGTHLSVPITFSDGTVYGTFCVFTHVPDPALGRRDLATLRLIAGLLGRHLERSAGEEARRAQDASDVRRVLACGDLSIAFQPVVDLTTRRVTGYEALSRFRSGTPDVWFTRAREAGLGVALELAAAREAVRRLPELPSSAYLAVNLSAATLCSDQAASALRRWPVHRLVLEITEQTEVTTYVELLARIAQVRRLGGRVAVDDAGSGYAGLQRVLALAPDVLKLDLALVRGIATDPARQALASAMRWFAARTGAALVAEGIENADDLETLCSLGIGYGQGYHLGRPAASPQVGAA